MKDNSIAILLATYNGEKYIKEQLDSIIHQTNQDWHLYVHDDGSTDGTVGILDSYASSHPEKITLLDYQPMGGPCKNFLSMVEKVEAPYYMFCDQDDVWLPEKIEKTLHVMRQAEISHGADTPILIHTDLSVVDENKNTINPSFWNYSKIYPQWFKSYIDYAALNPVTGCTMLFNAKAKEIIKRPYDVATMHDAWITFSVAAADGIIIGLEEAMILYRQHGNNTLGAKDANKLTLLYKIRNFLAIIKHKRARFREFNTIQKVPIREYMASKKRYKLFVKNR